MLRSLALPWLLLGCASPTPARCPEPAATGAATPHSAPGDNRAPHAHGDHSHGHGDHGPHGDHAHEARVIPHDGLRTFENNGNSLVGVATKSQGAANYEVWRTSVAVGSATPPHRHDTEEVFIFLRGRGKAVIGDQEFEFEAPATVIAPPDVRHQFFNTGDVPTDAIVVIGIDSRIYSDQGDEMRLPWRH
jgi:mannose-6-phosphate isomerase-like protein (cupin superfamily)